MLHSGGVFQKRSMRLFALFRVKLQLFSQRELGKRSVVHGGEQAWRERGDNSQTKRLMILQWALPVATNPRDPHPKTLNWVSTLNWLFFMASPSSWQPCPPLEVNSVSDVLIIDIWHFTLGRVCRENTNKMQQEIKGWEPPAFTQQ